MQEIKDKEHGNKLKKINKNVVHRRNTLKLDVENNERLFRKEKGIFTNV